MGHVNVDHRGIHSFGGLDHSLRIGVEKRAVGFDAMRRRVQFLVVGTLIGNMLKNGCHLDNISFLETQNTFQGLFVHPLQQKTVVLGSRHLQVI